MRRPRAGRAAVASLRPFFSWRWLEDERSRLAGNPVSRSAPKMRPTPELERRPRYDRSKQAESVHARAARKRRYLVSCPAASMADAEVVAAGQVLAPRAPGVALPQGRAFSLAMIAAILATVFVGFAPTYYLKGHAQLAQLPPVVHAH